MLANTVSSAVLRGAVRTARRSLATASMATDNADPEFVVFPRETHGVDYDLNWSLVDDGVTPSGNAFRNAATQDLIMHSNGSLTKDKALVSSSKPESAAGRFATDEFPGHSLLGIDDYEVALEDACSTLSAVDNLFVHDGAVGATRTSEVRVRVISDSADHALAMSLMLQRTPLYSPEAFPRSIVVYVATSSDASFVASDFDPEAAKATIVASGAVDAGVVRDEVAHVAGLLMEHGGYRHVRGGGPRVQLAREEGDIEWYMEDRHWVADASESHPSLIRLPVSAYANGDSVQLVAAGLGAGSGKLFSAHDSVLTPSGVDAMWRGIATGVDAGKHDSMRRGSIALHGAAISTLDSDVCTAGHATELVIPGGDLTSALSLTEEQATRLEAHISDNKVKVVRK